MKTKEKIFASSISIAMALSLTACGGSDLDDMKKMSDYEDCKAYNDDLAARAADAFMEALNYSDQAEAQPYLDKAEAWNEIIAENDCEAILE